MRNLLIGLTALFLTSPAFASVDHWTCSSDNTVLYLVLDTSDGNFMLWDDRGQFLAAAKFTEAGKTKNGTPFLAAELDNGTAVGIAKQGSTLVLAISAPNNEAARFTCN